ncbi:MAG: caspase family protein, partial [Anaerolineae bacterium]
MNSPWARTLFWGDESPDRKISDEFSRNLAVVIGIEHYAHVTPLPNAANDARALADLLREDHGFEITLILDAEATGDKLRAEFQDLGKRLSKGDRLLVYFAGHGIARDGDWGFLVPHDSESNKIESLLSMEDLRRWLSGLPCRHLLVLLDCCFAGTFQWSGKISRQRTRGVTLYREQYRRWVDNRAHQVITSAAFNQEALDSILIEDCEYKLGSRGAAIAEHSPFAYALLQVLGHPDDTGIEPLDTQSGLITAPALSGILQRTVVRLTGGKQHPQTFTLDEFDVGEYLFQLPGSSLILDHAEPLGKVTPWPGLRPYHQRDRRFFFGRDAEAAALVEHVTSHPITVLVGDSGVGKSSLLRAGLGPRLSSMPAENDGAGSAWAILPPMRPGDRPIMRLCAHLRAGLGKHVWQAAGMDGSQLDGEALRRLVATWAEANPNRRLLLIVDQFEDVFRRCCDEAERDSCMALLAELARAGSKHLAIVLALRSDFYPKLSASPLGEVLAGSHVQLLAPDPDELRDVIERPASLFGLFWDPESLPVALISDFGQEIGALALVSMLLHGLSQDVTPQERTLRGYQGDESFLRQQLDRVANKLGEEQQQEALGQLLLRMSEPEEKSSFRGRSVQDNELIFGSADVNAWVQEALDSLIAARLVVASSQDEHAVYQLAHSKLARVISQRYRNEILGLQATTAIPYKIRQELREAAQAWRGPEDAATEPLRGKDEHAETRSARLWHDDPRLPQVEEALWPTGGSQEGLIGRLRWEWRVLFPKLRAPAANGWLNQSEVEFVRLSVKKRAGFRQAALSVAILIFIVLFAFGAYAWCQRGIAATNEQIAKENQFKAERQAAIARARELAIRSQTVLDSDPRLALLLAVEAMTVTQKYPSAAES